MPSLDESLRLRLAARSLIEWRTPRQSADYQLVLNRLLSLHPIARSFGLGADILDLDDDGAILWYLSEITSGTPPAPGPEVVAVAELRLRTLEALLALRFGSEKPLLALRFGSEKQQPVVNISLASNGTEFEEVVLSALASDDSVLASLACRVVLALELGMSPRIVKENLEALRERRTGGVSFIGRLSKLVATGYSLVFILQLVLIPLAVFLLAHLAVSIKEWFNILINIPKGVFQIAALIAAIVSALGSTSLLKQRSTNVMQLILMVMEITVARKDARKRSSLIVSINSRLPGILRTVCAETDGMLAAIIEKGDSQLIGFALNTTREAREEVIREVLHVLRMPDLNNQIRNDTFQWLCGVRLVPAVREA